MWSTDGGGSVRVSRVALTTAEELGLILDHVDIDETERMAWVCWHAQMLEHWTRLVSEETSEYPCLVDQLFDFADLAFDYADQHSDGEA